MDDMSDYCWSFFLKHKSELAATVVQLIYDIYNKRQVKNGMIKYIRCDNAGENFQVTRTMYARRAWNTI